VRLSEQDMQVLRWRARRGLLENDLILGRFFNMYGDDLSIADAQDLICLLDLSDNNLLDLILAKTSLPADICTDGVCAILEKLQTV